METEKALATKKIKELALELGFSACGIARAARLDTDAQKLTEWLGTGRHASMLYMQNHFEERVDPIKLVAGTKSLVVVLLNYYPPKLQPVTNNLIISKYAYGKDYHTVVKKKLKLLQQLINSNIAQTQGRTFVDSAPVLERAWASLSGLGWIGKNANLISPKYGSFVFIGEIMLDIELEYDKPIPDYCGSCNKCIKACPTAAIVAPKIIDSKKCISYLTIENKSSIPQSFKGKLEYRIFGCDICQDVCPWNRNSRPHNIEDFMPAPQFLLNTRFQWQNISEGEYQRMFQNSAIKRAKFVGFRRNIDFVSG